MQHSLKDTSVVQLDAAGQDVKLLMKAAMVKSTIRLKFGGRIVPYRELVCSAHTYCINNEKDI